MEGGFGGGGRGADLAQVGGTAAARGVGGAGWHTNAQALTVPDTSTHRATPATHAKHTQIAPKTRTTHKNTGADGKGCHRPQEGRDAPGDRKGRGPPRQRAVHRDRGAGQRAQRDGRVVGVAGARPRARAAVLSVACCVRGRPPMHLGETHTHTHATAHTISLHTPSCHHPQASFEPLGLQPHTHIVTTTHKLIHTLTVRPPQASFEPLGLTIAVAKDRAIESMMQARHGRGGHGPQLAI